MELSKFANYFGCEITAFDIQTTHYDGFHYDALVLSPAKEALEIELALNFVKDQHTNTNIDLKR